MRPETVAKEFRKYLVRRGLHGTYLAINLHSILLQWLALPDMYRLYLDELTVAEQVALIEEIEAIIRKGWPEKAQKTKVQNKKQKEKRADAERQLHFKF